MRKRLLVDRTLNLVICIEVKSAECGKVHIPSYVHFYDPTTYPPENRQIFAKSFFNKRLVFGVRPKSIFPTWQDSTDAAAQPILFGSKFLGRLVDYLWNHNRLVILYAASPSCCGGSASFAV